MSTPTLVPMVAPDGTPGEIPADRVNDALAKQFKLGVRVKARSGEEGIIPRENVVGAIQKGFSVLQDSAHYDTHFEDERNPENQHGATHSAWDTLKQIPAGIVHGIAQGGEMSQAEPIPGVPNQPIEDTLTGQSMKADAEADARRKAEGRSVAYRAIAPVGEAVGVDVGGMEQAANIGNARGVIGHAVGSAIPPLTGAAIGELAPKVAPAIEAAAKDNAARMYQSALKPSTRLSPSKVATAVNTGLEHGIPVSEAGVEKLSSLIDDVNDKIKATIAADPARPVNKFAVASRLSDTAKKFATQVNPTADLNAINEAGNEFLDTQKNPIPAADAQALKTGTYQQLSSKAYGEMKSASIESQKALARGLKEELAEAFPELKDLNAQDTRFYGLEPILEKAVQRISNHQLIGIGTPAVGISAKAITGSGPAAAVSGFMKMLVDNPMVKSRLAIMLNKASKGRLTPAMAQSRVAAYSSALSKDASSASDETPADHTNE